MHKLRFAFSPGEEDPIERLSKALSMCEEIMDILFQSKNVFVKIRFWRAQDWRVSQTMLTIYDTINSSKFSEIKNTIENGKLSTIDVVIKTKKYDFKYVKNILHMVLSAELGLYDYMDTSIEVSTPGIIFHPYDDRGANLLLKSKGLFLELSGLYKENIIESHFSEDDRK